MDIPPAFDREFLGWLRENLERVWADYEPRDFFAAGVGGKDWRKGTRWLGGLSDAEIERAESRWGVTFPPDYRLFLSVLHAVDRPGIGAKYINETDMVATSPPMIYDWRDEGEAIDSAFAWPLEGLFFDLERNGLWLPAWGDKPASLEARGLKLRALVASAPRLIPVYQHRYLLGEPPREGKPVLSVYQSDIIIYGPDLRSYFLIEFADLLGLDRGAVEDEAFARLPRKLAEIPFWGEVASWHHSGRDA